MGQSHGKSSSVKKKDSAQGTGQLVFYWIAGMGLWLWALFAVASSSTGVGPLLSSVMAENEAKKTLVRIEKRVDDLNHRVAALRTDPFEMERQAREREHRLRPGEILVLPRANEEESR
ncbi:MAG: hypothetical protein ACP5OP_01385 [Leptospirillia bacterium]